MLNIYNSIASYTIENTNGHNVFERSLKSVNDTVDVVFFGDSMIFNGDWENAFQNKKVCVIGNYGMRIDQMFDRTKYINYYHPSSIVIWCGTNGANKKFANMSLEDYEYCYNKLLYLIQTNNKDAKIYCIGILPMADETKSLKKINDCNNILSKICYEYNAIFINASGCVIDDNGYLNPDYTTDGLHLNKKGYSIIYKIVRDSLL